MADIGQKIFSDVYYSKVYYSNASEDLSLGFSCVERRMGSGAGSELGRRPAITIYIKYPVDRSIPVRHRTSVL